MNRSILAHSFPYIPRDRIEHILASQTSSTPATLPEDGVALMADISGFTSLTEALTRDLSQDSGAEELTRALAQFFTPLVSQVHTYHGSIIRFAGDALLVWFGRPFRTHKPTVIRRAMTAAWRMQAVMAQYGEVSTPAGPVVLRMKIGLAYGKIQRFNLGLPEYGYEDVLVGATLDRMSEAEHHANPGEIIVDEET